MFSRDLETSYDESISCKQILCNFSIGTDWRACTLYWVSSEFFIRINAYDQIDR